jgi:hypothetical protein
MAIGCMALGLISLVLSSTALGQGVRYDDLPDAAQGNSSFSMEGNVWDKTILTYFLSKATQDLAGNRQRDALRQALQLWAAVTPLAFAEVGTPPLADITVNWEVGNHNDDRPFDGLNGVLAHAFFPPPNGAFAGDVHFDDAEQWVDIPRGESSQPIDLVTVAAHEIGHALGLGHSGDPNALMAAFYTGSHRFLGQDDTLGIQTLYGARPSPPQSVPGSPIISRSGTRIVWTAVAGATFYQAIRNGILAQPITATFINAPALVCNDVESQVIACNSLGCSAPSNTIHVRGLPGPGGQACN